MDKQWVSKQIGLLVVLAIFFTLAILHSIIVPITQGGDELAHYRYLSFIAQQGRLPTNAAEREQAWYRSDWPPLYHLLTGWTIRSSSIDTTRPHLKDVGESPHRRLVGEIFYPRLIIYTEDASWPWQDGILGWHLGRLISILFSVGTLILTYYTALELVRPKSLIPISVSPKKFALLTTTLLAFIPRFLFSSAMLGDDSLMGFLSALFIWLLVRTLRGNHSWKIYFWLGMIIGLSIATKYSTGLFPLAIIPVAIWQAKQFNWNRWQWLGRIFINWLATVVGASWWFGWIGYHFNTIAQDGWFFGLLHPFLNSGPDVSMRRIFAFFTGQTFSGQERPAAIEAGTFSEWISYLFQTFWGVPVLEHDPFFPWLYLPLILVCLLAGAGIWRLWRHSTPQHRVTLGTLMMIVGLLFPFPLLRFFLTYNVLETGQGRHILYPAAQAIPLLLVLGWGQMGERLKPFLDRTRHYFLPPPSQISFYIIAYLLLWSMIQLSYMNATYPAPLPVQTTTFETASISQPLNHEFSPAIQLLGYDWNPTPTWSTLELTLFWRSQKSVHENYRTQIQLIDSKGNSRLTWLGHPLEGRYPTRAWDSGDTIRDEISLPIVTLPPDEYTISVDLLAEAHNISLTDEPLTLTAIRLPANQNYQTQIQSLGEFQYHLWIEPETPLRYRQTIPLTWTPTEEQPTWSLVGPDNVPRFPAVSHATNAIFLVGADWPSGEYHLQVETENTDLTTDQPSFMVANDLRQFTLPSELQDYTSVEAHFADPITGDAQVELIGYSLPIRRAEPGGGLPITLYWKSLAPVLGDYVVFDVLLNKEQKSYGGYDRLPREYYSTLLWAEGEIIEDGFAVPIAPDAPPGVYFLHVGLYTLATGEPISLPLLQEGELTEVTSVVIGPIKVGGPPPDAVTAAPSPQVILQQPLGKPVQLTLLGYDLTDQDHHPLSDTSPDLPTPSHREQAETQEITSLNLTLYWQVEAPLPLDYTTFVHLRDAQDNPVTQQDNPPAQGQYPTSLWDSGEIIVDEMTLPVDEVSSGSYELVVGLYDFRSGVRLPVPGNPDNEVRLESVTLP